MKLKPCPFCGGEAYRPDSSDWDHIYSIRCKECGAGGPIINLDCFPKGGFRMADERWNERKEQ